MRRTDRGFALERGSRDAPVADVERSERALSPGVPYPRRIATVGRLAGGAAPVRQEYTLLAPPAPLPVEGLGLEVSTDVPGANAGEHDALRAWLGARGLPPDTRAFEEIHRADAGRELTVWYEISGRRVAGTLARGDREPAARFDSLFRVTADGPKIHHARPGENGRLFYHRKSLELVDTLSGWTRDGEPRELRSYQCGCYGYGIASDVATLGDSLLYRVEVEWLDPRVAADFFLGLETRDGFPWIGVGDRRRIRDLARRVRRYRVSDAAGETFADVAVAFPPEPPTGALGRGVYDVRRVARDGATARLARIEHRPDAISLELAAPWEASLERLDALLAAMPTQVLRGDGIRDSHLGAIEEFVDQIRLLLAPSAERLADLVSEVDALTAVAKVSALLEAHAPRFAAPADALPAAPARAAGSPFRSPSDTVVGR